VATRTHVKVDSKKVLARLSGLGKKAADLRAPNRQFAQYMRVTIDRHFKKLGKGGTNRGVTWKPFAPQYTRKADGVTVPAWGGVNKVRGRGKVKGRKRPSGTRITRQSKLVQDTGTLRSRAAAVIRMTRTTGELGPNLNYATKQNEKRPFLFFTKGDGRKYNQVLAAYFRKEGK